MSTMPNFFQIKPFESTSLYETLGIRWFKKYLITDGDVMRRRRQIKPERVRDVAVLKRLMRDTVKYETIHWLAMGVVLLLVATKYKEITPVRWTMHQPLC